MSEERLAFEPEFPSKKILSSEIPKREGFCIGAYYDGVEWSDFTEEVVSLDEKVWLRSSITPKKDELRKIKVKHPFNMKVGESFWSIFKPGYSYFNGWDMYPEEIDTSAMARCTFESIISRNNYVAWINIKIEYVLLLSEVCSIIPLEYNEKYIDDMIIMSKDEKCVIDYFGEWIIISNGNPYRGAWQLIRVHDDGTKSIVMYNEWGYDYDNVYCGNVHVEEEQFKKL